MELPTKTTPRSVGNPTIIIHGVPKVGKSTFGSKFPNPLFLATEPGLGALEVYQVPVPSWAVMLEALGEIAKGQHAFKTIVIDTIDNAQKMCEEHMMKKYKVEHPADLPYGKGFAAVNNELMRVLTKLAQMPYGLVLISHTKAVEVKGRTAVYSRQVPALPEASRKAILGFVDVILYAEAETVRDEKTGEPIFRRILRTKPSDGYEAGDRFGLLPESLPLDYAEFAKHLKG